MPCLRSMQTTNRYEHSLDSAMRPVRPDGISRRIREHPLLRAPHFHGPHLHEVCARRRHDPHGHCGVSVKTSSESESVARRTPDPGEEIDLAEEHPVQFPFRSGIWGSSPRLATNEIAGARWFTARCRCRQQLLALPRGETSAPPPSSRRRWRSFASVIAAIREH